MREPLVKLRATTDQLDELFLACDKVRKSSKSVTVNRDTLMAVLMDFAELINQGRRAGVEIQDAEGNSYRK